MDRPATALIKVTLIWGLLILNSLTFAQQDASPFDILPRLPQVSLSDGDSATAVPSNPFDINRLGPSRPSATQRGVPQFQVQRKQKPLSAKEKTALYQRFLLVAIVTMLVILTLVVTIFRIFIGKIWEGFLNDNILSQLLREQGAGVTMSYVVLYIMFFINAGIFAFLALKHFDIKMPYSNIYALLLCIGGIAGFYIVKHLLLAIIRFVFPVEKEVSRYNFTIVVFNIVTGILLVPLILFAAYSSEGISGLIIKLTILLLAGIILFRGLRGLFIANKFFAWHKFHFFLYLCAVEIAPLLATFKLLGVI